MNSRISNDGDRFDVLCEAIFDGDASTDHITEFDALLLSDAALRDEYLDRCRLHTELAFHAKAHHAESATLDAVDAAMEERPTAISDTSPRPSSLVSRRFRTFVREHNFAVGVAVAFVFLSALLSVAHFTDFNWFAQRDTDQDNPSPVADREVATLTAWRSPEWVKEHAISPRDHRIAVGQTVALASGLIEITYDSGAKVVIEGPAEFVIGGTKAGGTEAQGREAGSGEPVHPSSFILHPSNSGYLILGKLVARCEPPESKGFAIFTPNARVVDLGTEFGIEVDERGSEVAVLTGEVELTSAAADGTKQTIRLAKDEGASVAAESGSVVRHETADVRMIATMRRRMHRIHEPIPDNLARIKSITGSHGGDKYAPGGFYSMTNRSGMSGRVFNDPTTWTNVSTHYKDEWQATTLLEGATNGKIAWLVFDLGEVTERLDKLHLWNVTYANGTRGVKTYNIYYASAPEAQLSVAPEVGKDGTDYDFSSGGWTPLDGSGALTAEKSGKAIINLGSISARYIGVEILASYDDSLGRVGLAEVAIIKAADDVHPTDGEPNENKTDIELAPEGEQ